MRSIVLAEHDGSTLHGATLCTIAAAQKLGHPCDLLLVGSGVEGLADTAATIPGLEKVLVADSTDLEHPIAENFSQILIDLADSYSHILAPATTFGKNILPDRKSVV